MDEHIPPDAKNATGIKRRRTITWIVVGILVLVSGPLAYLAIREFGRRAERKPAAPEVVGNALPTAPAPSRADAAAAIEPARPAIHGRLVRELARQALLITSRDELGLPTRDLSLGESPAEDGAAASADAQTSVDAEGHVEIIVSRQRREGTERLAEYRFDLPPGELIEQLATKAESLSADELVAALKDAEPITKALQFLPQAAVAVEIEDNLEEFDWLSQFAAVRALHAEIRNSGESPERLAALARGYAHLGAVTDCLWSPAYKVFQARSLLYAERLMRKTNRSLFARRYRAYVRALVGLHTSALADLAAAKAESNDETAPEWTQAIDAYCRSDSRWLTAMADEETEKPLLLFLNMLLAAHSESAIVRLKAAERMLAAQPDCILAFEVMLNDAPLGTRRQAADGAVPRFSQALRGHLASVGVPVEIRSIAVRPARGFAAEMAARARLIASLREAGALGGDADEPSLGALAMLIEETSFVHGWRLLDVENSWLAVDTTETLAALRPLLADHRFKHFLEIHVLDNRSAVVAVQALAGSMEESRLSSPPRLS